MEMQHNVAHQVWRMTSEQETFRASMRSSQYMPLLYSSYDTKGDNLNSVQKNNLDIFHYYHTVLHNQYTN